MSLPGRRPGEPAHGRQSWFLRVPTSTWLVLAISATLAITANSIAVPIVIGRIADVQRTTCQAVLLVQLRSLASVAPGTAKALAGQYGIPSRLIPAKPNPLARRVFRRRDLPVFVRFSEAQIKLLAARCDVA